eukprot:CAMPEP_0185037854 /NCGR_PEP_ID=MMETSP1103-20130426/32818_1 /TAXON_ID=36769 /ORGANISM="Paraphysomonas bandaiensis, Strain Caron Lab Isolate" /LENGTH=90 /DNA_ID=CAMNT_0027576021 /DNA_START=30 /DNA_END=299 /DNA_ORIENTATION=-
MADNIEEEINHIVTLRQSSESLPLTPEELFDNNSEGNISIRTSSDVRSYCTQLFPPFSELQRVKQMEKNENRRTMLKKLLSDLLRGYWHG